MLNWFMYRRAAFHQEQHKVHSYCELKGEEVNNEKTQKKNKSAIFCFTRFVLALTAKIKIYSPFIYSNMVCIFRHISRFTNFETKRQEACQVKYILFIFKLCVVLTWTAVFGQTDL